MDAFFTSPFPSTNAISISEDTPSIHILESWYGSVPASDSDSESRVHSIHIDHPDSDSEPALIAGGDDKWAQVWKGKIHMHYDSGKNSNSNSDDELELVEVAIKIYQESLFPEEDFVEEEDRATGAELALTEARAYTAMKKLQGEIIPKSFGFHKIIVRSNWKFEVCFAHIMQFIPLPTLMSLPDPMSDDTVSSLLDLLVSSLHEIHKCGISHKDLSPNNVLALADTNTDTDTNEAEAEANDREPIVSRLYLIDFSMSGVADAETISRDANRIIGTLRELRHKNPESTISRWYNHHLSDPYATSTFANVTLIEERSDSEKPVEYPDVMRAWREAVIPKPGSIWYGVPRPALEGYEWYRDAIAKAESERLGE